MEEKDIQQVAAELADAITALSAVGRALKSSKLKERTILLLIRDLTLVPMGDIKKVLDALPRLEAEYLKPATVEKALKS